MAFPMPRGLWVVGERQVASDAEVAEVENGLPPSTRMLVALGFAFKWPGFGVWADSADWAARNITGLQPWPEYGRVITPDPDGEPIWWVTYRSSPAWFLPVLAAIAVFVVLAIAFRVVRWVAPELAAPIESTLNLVPMLVMLLFVALVPPLLRDVVPKYLPGAK